MTNTFDAIDPTTTDAWAALDEHAEQLDGGLREWFAADPQRTAALTFDAADLHVDLSKNLIKPETLSLLLQLAEQTDVLAQRDAMFAGAHINNTEDRAVLHTALRRPVGTSPALEVDGQDVDADVQAVLAKIYAFAQKVRSGEWTGITGKRIETVVNIGIGGSDLGPVMVYEALKPHAQPGLSARFISNIDPTDVAATVADLDPETTLFIVASKTFT
ncbi:glucose-6-phosphate isomerase, partial [Dermabacteraceae bacterium P13101]